MSEVKRYSHNGLRGMLEHKAGRYVSYERYAALKAERDELAAENEEKAKVLCDILQPEAAVLDRKHRNRALSAIQAPDTDAYLNSVRAEAISNALDSSSALCDPDCVMDAHDISHEDAELRSSGAAELSDELLAYANQLRAGKDGK
ncbi:hypothetical protein PAASB05_11585 [Pantoea agglomerans]|uniref:hypothetical protein n=1 Tax=Enterobacter agglomerans TaxID=549 RepID=UPI0013024913|nr:hypothetical protein [Pantoea agglomerans]QGY58503.1 hypothetical protein PAASB05_11585 [Pantoea agglomerans]WNK43054.1 hypothetical protein RM150_11270 [Pantoea agglomerans]